MWHFANISIHALREEGDPSVFKKPLRRSNISIHALREEGDSCYKPLIRLYDPFLSTPSARRATILAFFILSHFLFLSTPSARRATHCRKRGRAAGGISIHALREEGDSASPS